MTTNANKISNAKEPIVSVPIAAGLIVTSPITIPLSLFGWGIGWCFDLAISTGLSGILFFLVFLNKEKQKI